jgi:hypothetical protein
MEEEIRRAVSAVDRDLERAIGRGPVDGAGTDQDPPGALVRR